MKHRVHYTRPSITDLEISYAADAAANGWGDQCYGYINRFEEAFKKHLNVKYAIATSSCTGALHMGFAALGLASGDEVIMADSNWIASVAPITYLGATPVFVDIRPDTWCLDPEAVERAITPKTKAILAVHLYGNLCDLSALQAIADKYGIALVEDAAEAIGSEYQGKKAGSIGKFGAFSFHGTKTITTGEGGIFVTNDEDLYDRALTLSNHGRSRNQSLQFWPDTIGFKYKMSNIQAAVGLAQVERVDGLIARKREIFLGYRDQLADLKGVNLNFEQTGCRIGAWMPTVVFDAETGVTRERLKSAFQADNIDARVFFYPLSSLSFFSPAAENIHAFDIPSRAINLPSFHDITNEDQDRVMKVVRSCLHATS